MIALANDVRLFAQLVADLDIDVNEGSVGEDIQADLVAWHALEQATRSLADVRKQLTDRLAKAMPSHSITVMGTGTFTRHQKKNRTKWDTDELVRAVLDSRLADPETGEIKDESPLDRVLHVWNLGVPRLSALRARGIGNVGDVDKDGKPIDEFGEWCHVEPAGYGIEFQ